MLKEISLVIISLSAIILSGHLYGHHKGHNNSSDKLTALYVKYKDYNFEHNLKSMTTLKTVRPKLQEMVLPILAQLEDQGYTPIVQQGYRTLKQQRIILRQGNSKTIHSKHLLGAAVDVTDKYGWDGKASNLSYSYWQEQGRIVDNTPGLEWGGDWGRGYERYFKYVPKHTRPYFCDVAHIQLSSTLIKETDEEWYKSHKQ